MSVVIGQAKSPAADRVGFWQKCATGRGGRFMGHSNIAITQSNVHPQADAIAQAFQILVAEGGHLELFARSYWDPAYRIN